MIGFNRKGRGTSPYTHRWINSPNKTRQKCTACGMLKEVSWNKELKQNEVIYTSKDGVRTKEYQQCTVESYGDIA